MMSEVMNEKMNENVRLLEAILFRAAAPVSAAELQAAIGDEQELEQAMQCLEARYAQAGIRVVKRGESWAMVTADDLADRLKIAISQNRTLSRAAMETLAIIAYYQPITRAEIEEIRGVSLARSTLDQLLDAGWVVSQGHRPIAGRPSLWGTTTGFLHHFGLGSLHDLPMREDWGAQGGLPASAVPQPDLFDYSGATVEDQARTDSSDADNLDADA